MAFEAQWHSQNILVTPTTPLFFNIIKVWKKVDSDQAMHVHVSSYILPGLGYSQWIIRLMGVTGKLRPIGKAIEV